MKNLKLTQLVFNLTLLSTILINFPVKSQTHGNIRIMPKQDTVCYGQTLSVWIAGQSFQPISYAWSNGQTTPTIQATSSGLYTLNLYGYLGQSLQTRTISKYVHVLPKPEINPLTATWVCKLDSVKLSANSNGYNNFVWNNGSTNPVYTKIFSSIGGGQVLDTVSVWFTANINGLCSANSDTIVIRGIRRPEALTPRFCGTSNGTSDSVKSGLVLEYIYPVQYEMEFTNMTNTSQVYNLFSNPGSRWVQITTLPVGQSYYVRTRPIINNISFCWGDTCIIAINNNSQNIDVTKITTNPIEDNSQTIGYKIFDSMGKLIIESNEKYFQNKWIADYPSQVFIILELKDNGKFITWRQIVR